MTLQHPVKRPFLAPSSSFISCFFGHTRAMQQIRRNLELLSQTDLPVLLQGESGTGKGVISDLLHQQSRTFGPLTKFSCAASKEASTALQHLMESEARLRTQPDFSSYLREGGTVILDGIHELDAHLQAKLLIALERHDSVGASVKNSTRIISTTNQDLQALIAQGKFRIDLLYRINAVKITLPPLRERAEDIRDFVEFFVQKHSREIAIQRQRLSEDAIHMLEGYRWPGNIRQLDNLLRNFVLMGSEDVLTRDLLRENSDTAPNWILDQVDVSRPVALKEITRQVTQDLERQIIFKVLKANGWNRQKTAKWLSISYRSLLYKLSDFGVLEDQRALTSAVPARSLRAANY